MREFESKLEPEGHCSYTRLLNYLHATRSLPTPSDSADFDAYHAGSLDPKAHVHIRLIRAICIHASSQALARYATYRRQVHRPQIAFKQL